MQVSNINNSPNFGIRICNDNNALTEIVECAKKRHILPVLDGILNNLYHVTGGYIVIIHGTHKESGAMYSYFSLGKNTVVNNVTNCASPAHASLQGLFDLLDKNNPKLMQLLESKIHRRVTPEYIIKRYSAK